jgi:cell fate regulator YaaT (PSP1 superfamily)
LWFDPAGTDPQEGDTVIVETERGTELGTVVHGAHEVSATELHATLKPVVRVAGEEDLAYAEELELKEREAMPVFRDMVARHGLDMKPIDVEYLYGGDKVVFYFASEERVDFRDLVRDLAAHFRARIDMRQVGVRDEARAVGGIGHCGQMLCCVRLGGDFQPVSIRMAKEQDLPLNPLKISGLCGRLMCCLRYEFDAYKDFKGRAPRRGAIIETAVGLAKVADLNTPRELVQLRFEDGSRTTVPLASMECAKGSGCPCKVGAEALEEAGNAAALAAASEKAAAFEPVELTSTPRPKRSERPSPRGEVEGETAGPEAGSGGSSRRRRRRSKSGGGEGATAEQSTGASEPKRVPRRQSKPAEGDSAGGSTERQAAAGDKPARSGRRRRRRRPGGGASSAAE